MSSCRRRAVPWALLVGCAALSLVGCLPFQDADGDFPQLTDETDSSTGDDGDLEPGDVEPGDVGPDDADVVELDVPDAVGDGVVDAADSGVPPGDGVVDADPVDALDGTDGSLPHCVWTEVCGNGFDDDCDDLNDDVDPDCKPLETLYVAGFGSDDGEHDGSAALPYASVGRALEDVPEALDAAIEIRVAQGEYTESTLLLPSSGVELVGGFACDGAGCDWPELPSGRSSITLLPDARIFIEQKAGAPDGLRATRLRNVAIDGGAGEQTDTGLVIVKGGHPVISGNVIRGYRVESGWSAAIELAADPSGVTSTQRVLIQDNDLYGGDVGGNAASSYAVFAREGAAPVTLRANSIAGGKGHITLAVKLLGRETSTLIEGNHIDAGDGVGVGARSYGLWIEGSPRIVDNTINLGTGPTQARGSCPENSLQWCGGIHLVDSRARVVGNVVAGLDALSSAAIDIDVADPAFDHTGLHIEANTLDARGRDQIDSYAAAIRCGRDGVDLSSGASIELGTVRNNIFDGGPVSERRVGYLSDVGAGASCDPAELEYNGFVTRPGGAAPDFYERRGADRLAAHETGTGNVILGGEVYVDYPDDLHLAEMSEAIDAGWYVSGVSPDTDIDGEARPSTDGYDLGADEWYRSTTMGAP